jgi:hypothetical protein
MLNILFCCEGFIIDGVASFNLHMAASFREAGHRVAVLGRRLGKWGYQKRHIETGVEVLQYFSPGVVCGRALSMAKRFYPDVIITDGRRAFPLALEIHRRLGTPIVTSFLDTPCGKDKPGRTMREIHDNSAAWVSSEKRQIAQIEGLSPGIPFRLMRRAVSPRLLPSTPLPGRDPFRVLCIGRLSNYKFSGAAAVVRNARGLMSKIPSLEITVVGGGWRKVLFARDAALTNLSAGRKAVRIAGYQTDPAPWFAASTVVCGGASCGMEAILSGRPVIAMSGHWFGLVTPENLKEADDTFYGERGGRFWLKNNPEVVLDEITDLYENWEDGALKNRTDALKNALSPEFSPELAVRDWEKLFNDVL